MIFSVEGKPNRLAPHNVYLSKLGRTVSPHVYCHHHQNPRAGNALTISPFLVDDDNHTNITGDLENVDGAPPECEHYLEFAFKMQNAHTRINAPPRFYRPTSDCK